MKSSNFLFVTKSWNPINSSTPIKSWNNNLVIIKKLFSNYLYLSSIFYRIYDQFDLVFIFENFPKGYGRRELSLASLKREGIFSGLALLTFQKWWFWLQKQWHQ